MKKTITLLAPAPRTFTGNKERDGIRINGDAELREANSAVSENELINFLINLKPNTMKHANQSNSFFSFHSSLIQKGKRKMFLLLAIIFTMALSPSYNFAQSPVTLDASFNPGTGADNTVHSMAIQSDGKIVIVGNFTSYNGTSINRVARLNTDGTLDATFNPGGTGANAEVYALAVQSDGKILIGGLFTTYNGTARQYLARLNTDGTLDATFPGGSAPNNFVLSIAVQSDGKILIGGYFTSFKVRIARLNADGTWDATFNPGSGPNSNIWSIAVQSDGKILIGGIYSTYNGATVGRNIARLNADGTLDASFNPGGSGCSMPDGYIYSVAIQSDGKILIGGMFGSYNGTTITRIARLNADGTLDASFNPGTGANATVRSIVIQSDGKILIGGDFTSYNGTTQNRIARLNADGTLDATFDTGTGVDNTISRIAIQSDGKILICGSFTSYNGTAINRIARLLWDITPSIAVNSLSSTNLCTGNNVTVNYTCSGFTPTGNINVELSDSSGSFASPVIIGTGTGPSGSIVATIPGNTPVGTGYRIRVVSSNPADTSSDNGKDISINKSITDVAFVAISASSTSVCQGKTVIFSATPTNGGTKPAYQWKVNGVNVGTDNSTFSTSSLANQDSVNCILTSGIACITGSPATSNTLLITVSDNVQSGTVTALRDTICRGTPALLNVTGSSGAIQWQTSQTNVNYTDIAGASETSYTPLPDTDSYYRVYTTNGNCSDTATGVKIIVKPSPIADFTYTQTGSNDKQISFNTGGTQDASIFEWDFGNGDTSNEINPVYTYAKEGLYHVCLTVYNGSNCSFSICKDVQAGITGTGDIEQYSEWKIYPSPFSSDLYIELPSNHQIKQVELIDVAGKMIKSEQITEGTGILRIDGKTLPQGVYFLKAMLPHSVYVQKVVKMN